MKKALLIAASLLVMVGEVDAQKKDKKPKISKMDKEFLKDQPDGLYAKLETNRGDIYLLLEDKKSPLSVANFVGLAEGTIKNTAKPEGTPYYDGLKFHRIIPGFMIQGGCPLGNGSGDPGYKFPDELDPTSDLAKQGYKRGTLAMANAGPNTNGSQFFIMHKDYGLGYNYNIFGRVVKGIEVVDSIANTPRDGNDRPKQDQVINHISILRKGKEAEKYDGGKSFAAAQEGLRKKNEEREAKAKAEAEAMIAKIQGGSKTASGLQYFIEREGTGVAPKPSSKVTVHYRGMLTNGKQIDSSYDRGQPASFGLPQLVPGWIEGMQLIKPGGKIYLMIPPSLGWGDRGAGDAVPPNSTVLFQVELISVDE